MDNSRIYKQFLSLCDNGYARVTPEGSIVEVNKALCELTGRGCEDLEGAGLDILFDNLSVDRILSIYDSYDCTEICHTISGDLLQKRGEPRNAEIYVACTDCVYWLLIKNKSFRREMEEKLRKSELMLSTCIESLPFDFWINDAENRTWMQNSISKDLWGNAKGKRPEAVGADPEISKQWLETTEKALKGEIVTGEITYDINNRKKIYKNVIAPIRDDDKLLGILGMNIDITDLKEALAMKDQLLKEVYHRVNNNLHMINSIINLEASELECGEDNHVFEDLINRIEAISLVHEKLRDQKYGDKIQLSDYIRELVDYVISGIELQKVFVNYDLDDFSVNTDQVILIGLIVNELVANSVNYAFGREEKLQLNVSLKRGKDDFTLEVDDHGPGMPEGCRENIWNSLGLKLIEALAQQLEAGLVLDDDESGCRTVLRVPLKKTETEN